MKFRLSNCSFAKPTVDFLGFAVSAVGVFLNATKLKAIRKFPTPQNLIDLGRFLGMACYYRRLLWAYIARHVDFNEGGGG